MKNILLVMVVLSLVSCMRKETYCGKITKMYRTTAGYRVQEEKHIIFYVDTLRKKVDVEVTDNTYANAEIGQHICFKLYDRDIK